MSKLLLIFVTLFDYVGSPTSTQLTLQHRYNAIFTDVIEKLPVYGVFLKMDAKYGAYLKSSEWADIKVDLLQTRGYSCQRCGKDGSLSYLQIHHLTYDRLYNEEPSDLLVVCPKCHRKIHGLIPDRVLKNKRLNKNILNILKTGKKFKIKSYPLNEIGIYLTNDRADNITVFNSFPVAKEVLLRQFSAKQSISPQVQQLDSLTLAHVKLELIMVEYPPNTPREPLLTDNGREFFVANDREIYWKYPYQSFPYFHGRAKNTSKAITESNRMQRRENRGC